MVTIQKREAIMLLGLRDGPLTGTQFKKRVIGHGVASEYYLKLRFSLIDRNLIGCEKRGNTLRYWLTSAGEAALEEFVKANPHLAVRRDYSLNVSRGGSVSISLKGIDRTTPIATEIISEIAPSMEPLVLALLHSVRHDPHVTRNIDLAAEVTVKLQGMNWKLYDALQYIVELSSQIRCLRTLWADQHNFYWNRERMTADRDYLEIACAMDYFMHEYRAAGLEAILVGDIVPTLEQYAVTKWSTIPEKVRAAVRQYWLFMLKRGTPANRRSHSPMRIRDDNWSPLPIDQQLPAFWLYNVSDPYNDLTWSVPRSYPLMWVDFIMVDRDGKLRTLISHHKVKEFVRILRDPSVHRWVKRNLRTIYPWIEPFPWESLGFKGDGRAKFIGISAALSYGESEMGACNFSLRLFLHVLARLGLSYYARLRRPNYDDMTWLQTWESVRDELRPGSRVPPDLRGFPIAGRKLTSFPSLVLLMEDDPEKILGDVELSRSWEPSRLLDKALRRWEKVGRPRLQGRGINRMMLDMLGNAAQLYKRLPEREALHRAVNTFRGEIDNIIPL